MRIRSIKPEFWSHPVLARESDAVKLLALGLLSYADDEGFFAADETLVRNAVRPFDYSSGITLECLDRLQALGYIETRVHETHGKLGKVVNFTKHQKISHPTKSRIPKHWDEAGATVLRNNSGAIPETFRPDQGIKGSREQGAGSEIPPPPPYEIRKATPPIIDPSEQDVTSGPARTLLTSSTRLMGIMELCRIPHLITKDSTEHPTWLDCLNVVGVETLTQAARQIVTQGGKAWCSTVTALAFQLHRDAKKPKPAAIEQLPDDLNELPDGHPMKPRPRRHNTPIPFPVAEQSASQVQA